MNCLHTAISEFSSVLALHAISMFVCNLRQSYCNQTRCLIIYVSTYVGVSELYQDLQSVKDVDMLEVSTLHAILAKESFDSLTPFAEKFSRICKSRFFDIAWKRQLDIMLRDNPFCSISDLEMYLWQPTLKSCCQFLGEVTTQKVKLSTVQSAFKNCSEHNIHRELTEFCNLVNECMGHQNLFVEESMSRAVKKIKEYFVILQHQEIAFLFLQVKKMLQLTGDFRDISVIASKVCMMNMHFWVTTCVHIVYVIFNADGGQ